MARPRIPLRELRPCACLYGRFGQILKQSIKKRAYGSVGVLIGSPVACRALLAVLGLNRSSRSLTSDLDAASALARI